MNRLTRNLLWMLILPLQSVIAQKPAVQVTFTIEKNNPFYERYEDDVSIIESEGLLILMDGLKKYIGFVEFVDSTAPRQLAVSLSRKFANPILSEYYLLFNFSDGQGTELPHQWKFLSFVDFTSLGVEVDQVLQKLELSWMDYLKGHYNQDLVAKLFHRVALSLPDSTHYFIDPTANIQEAILPFAKEELHMDPEESEFRVFVVGQLADGTETQDQQNAATFSGDVGSSMPNMPEKLLGCIRIKLQALPVMRLINGKVFVTKYERKIYDDTVDPEDFLSGI